MRWSVLTLLVVTACATDAGPDPDNEPGGNIDDPTDNDQDGIGDALERHLMERFGPELRLPPANIDWTRPANVDWYLPQMKMRFDHAGCPDDSENLLDVGNIDFDNLSQQTHYTKAGGTGLCRHNDGADDLRESSKRALEFFLEAGNNDAVHKGIPDERASEWRAYIQVRPSSYVTADGRAAAYDLQVWDFFPYNDNIGGANHEADWEHMTISISSDLAVVSVFYATHNEGHRVDDLTKLQWTGEHVVGYVADGSHATYESPGDHPGPVVADHCYDGGPVWNTWENFANLGQLGHILDGQTWAAYGGRWGEVGETDFTSGPVGPMFNGKWDTSKEY
jgi:hypothetical protein